MERSSLFRFLLVTAFFQLVALIGLMWVLNFIGTAIGDLAFILEARPDLASQPGVQEAREIVEQFPGWRRVIFALTWGIGIFIILSLIEFFLMTIGSSGFVLRGWRIGALVNVGFTILVFAFFVLFASVLAVTAPNMRFISNLAGSITA